MDGYGTRYLYDGPHVIAEYDGNNNLLRKYIYGPGIDQPVCMIEVAESNAAYYYHFDGLGSVVALSDSSGNTVQTYEYSVYGQVAVEDINHPNPYMFAGRRFDIEIGLYYNRARYYNPFISRILGKKKGKKENFEQRIQDTGDRIQKTEHGILYAGVFKRLIASAIGLF